MKFLLYNRRPTASKYGTKANPASQISYLPLQCYIHVAKTYAYHAKYRGAESTALFQILPYYLPINLSEFYLFIFKNLDEGFLPFHCMYMFQPSSLYQRCFLFSLLKDPDFPTVFLENFPIFEGFLKAKYFPIVKVRSQGCQKKIK